MQKLKTKVLLLNVNRSGWHSGNMIYDMMVIQRACDTKTYGPGWDNYENNDMGEIIKQLYGNDKPDIIYSYFTENERVRDVYRDQYNIPEHLMNFPIGLNRIKDVVKVFAISDFWARSPKQMAIDLHNNPFNHCVSCFTPPYSKPKDFYAFFNEDVRKNMKFHALPRCVDKDCFMDYGLSKKYDVITLGSMCNFYPLRRHINNCLTKNASELSIVYKNYPHCGTNFKHSDFVRDKYAMGINESKMLVSCGGRYHLAFNKIFEAMGCNTLYVGEKPYGEKELHLEDGYNYVAVDGNNFIDRIKYYLSNEDKAKEIVKNANDTFLKYHHIDARADDFANLMEDILKCI